MRNTVKDTGYYDRQGNPISMVEWSRKFGDKKYQIIKQEEVGTFFISTVWLGSNHRFGPGEPVIFETMVFARGDLGAVEDSNRYCTEQEAMAGHLEFVKKYTVIVNAVLN